jgi:hypothetical protein
MIKKSDFLNKPGPLGVGKVLYLQFTNPTAYPPLENSASIFAGLGWRVNFLGVRWQNTGNFSFGPKLNVKLNLMSAPAPGWRQKVFYIKFMAAAVAKVWRERPDWVYVSDPMAAPIGWILKVLGSRVIYHEHDCPCGKDTSTFMKMISMSRRALARTADFNVLPQQERIRLFIKETGTRRPVYCVWNCPSATIGEVAPPRPRSEGEALCVYFHGSINLDRVPLTLIEGAKRSGVPVLLRVVGYETVGSSGTTDCLRLAAEDAGPMVRMEFPGTRSHYELACQMDGFHVGWMSYRSESQDVNLINLAGASNKAFDYLSSGLALLVRRSPDWSGLFVAPGHARECNPDDPDSIAAAIRWFYHHPAETAAMGRAGQQRIREEWNYEKQFAPVLERIKLSLIP